MAKGKYAARAQLRVQRTVDEHIDRLTSQLVEAKALAKQYEQRAKLVPDLEKRIVALERQIQDDVVLREMAEYVEALRGEVDVMRRHWFAHRDAFMDLARRYNHSVLRMPGSNYVEWLKKKWPDLFSDSEKRFEGNVTPTARKLSDEALYRLQVLAGERFCDHDGMPLVGMERFDGEKLRAELEV